MKPYQKVPIEECSDPLVPIPLENFSVTIPHPYEALGAPYGEHSPYFLRQGVLDRLVQAQDILRSHYPGWQLTIFDAYRPIPVQQFMVDYTFSQLAAAEGIDPIAMEEEVRSRIQSQVLKFWAVPSSNPNTPPPHSTGAAVDLTMTDAAGNIVDMGSPIDEVSPRSYPDHFANADNPKQQNAHHHRSLLAEVMVSAGFRQHPNEWWHFSWGDQLWAWQTGDGAIARYGKA